ncbi:MAG TPA: NADH-quinone oxidoreductase subunit J [Gemmatimonadaceae bacterium]|jgi:NADH-quinone oxidoreductase subunit J|nr:NADH-quinone oxidoreductase subunit J [Gemmatimonadaceae bacterium]
MPNGFVYEFLFYLFGLTAIVSAAIFVTRRNAVAAALWLVNTMFCLAALYIMMDAQFVGAIQVLVYAGAIMVVFLFVVMLLNLGLPPSVADIKSKGARIIALVAGLAMLAELLVLARQKLPAELPWLPRETSVTTPITEPLFRTYLLPFEITSVLLLVAIVGAVVLAKRRS